MKRILQLFLFLLPSVLIAQTNEKLPDSPGGTVEVKPEIIKPAPADLSANTIVMNYVNLSGGEQKWLAVRDIAQMIIIGTDEKAVNINSVRKAPNKVMVDVNSQGKTIQKTVFDGEKGYTMMRGNTMQFDEEKVKEMKAENICGDLVYLTPGYQVLLKGIVTVEDEDAYLVEVTTPLGKIMKAYYSIKTGFKIKSEEKLKTKMGDVIQSTFYKEYRETTMGLKFPFIIKRISNGQTVDMKVMSVEINAGIRDEMFQ